MVDEKSEISVEERLKSAEKPSKDAMIFHKYYRGKMEIVSKVPVRTLSDFDIYYTPGVAAPCKAIEADLDMSYSLTNRGNTIAIVSDGSRVLGLGNIGAEAGMPVMEGKCIIFKYLGGVDAIPLCLDTRGDIDLLVHTVKVIQPSFGAINLEDISQPACFYALETLRNHPDIHIPIFHDDQQGTATVVLSATINALKFVGKDPSEILISMLGAGASNIAISRLLISWGIPSENIIMVDSRGILHPGRTELRDKYPQKWKMCNKTNGEGRTGSTAEAIKGTDLLIALSTPGPGVVTQDMVKSMAHDSIVFACANPVPEIWPWEAEEAGAHIIATGRSDFPNQVNNSLGFPGIFRGTLDVRARTITDEMCLTAAEELAKVAEDSERGLVRDHIVPDMMEDQQVFVREAVAVALKAIEQGVARIKRSRSELTEIAETMIKRARSQADFLFKEGFIKPAPPTD